MEESGCEDAKEREKQVRLKNSARAEAILSSISFGVSILDAIRPLTSIITLQSM